MALPGRGFDVNIAGAAFQGVEDGRIDQLDDRRDVAIDGGELIDREGFSEFSSSMTTSRVKPSVTSSRTRWDCSVFLSRSEIWERVRL